MSAYLMVVFVASLNFLFGAVSGYIMCRVLTKGKFDLDEKTTYCHGFEDGIYYSLDEYNPELFKIEMAERSYKEYKAINRGPEKQ